jgi:hypothetical protein
MLDVAQWRRSLVERRCNGNSPRFTLDQVERLLDEIEWLREAER